MSFVKTVSKLSVGFVISPFRPQQCGVSDYCIRMACAFRAIGWEAFVIDGSNITQAMSIKTSEGCVEILPLRDLDRLQPDVLSIQFVPHNTFLHWRWIHNIIQLKPKVCHLMMHEYWNIGTSLEPLNMRGKLRALAQRAQCEWLRRRVHPSVITTSSVCYQQILGSFGWPVLVSPMPGNIPANTSGRPPAKLKNIDWFNPDRHHFTWLTFGSLYTRHWRPVCYFKECRRLADLGSHNPKWVIAGRQNQQDVEALLAAATQFGFAKDIEIVGSCEPDEVHWLLNHADAQLTGVPPNCWDKSGGVLAGRERNLPVFSSSDGAEMLRDFLSDPVKHTEEVVLSNQLHPQINPTISATTLVDIYQKKLRSSSADSALK